MESARYVPEPLRPSASTRPSSALSQLGGADEIVMALDDLDDRLHHSSPIAIYGLSREDRACDGIAPQLSVQNGHLASARGRPRQGRSPGTRGQWVTYWCYLMV